MRGTEGRTLLTTHTHAQTHTHMDVRPHVTVVSCLFICMRRTFCLCRRACGQAGADWDHFQMPFTLKPMRERESFSHICDNSNSYGNTGNKCDNTHGPKTLTRGMGRGLWGVGEGVRQRLLPKVRCPSQSHAPLCQMPAAPLFSDLPLPLTSELPLCLSPCLPLNCPTPFFCLPWPAACLPSLYCWLLLTCLSACPYLPTACLSAFPRLAPCLPSSSPCFP